MRIFTKNCKIYVIHKQVVYSGNPIKKNIKLVVSQVEKNDNPQKVGLNSLTFQAILLHFQFKHRKNKLFYISFKNTCFRVIFNDLKGSIPFWFLSEQCICNTMILFYFRNQPKAIKEDRIYHSRTQPVKLIGTLHTTFLAKCTNSEKMSLF